MNVKPLSIELLRTDGGTQMRAELSKDVYLDYRDKWIAGVEFDPVDVFHDGSAYWLADGFHRFYGAREAKRSSIPCRIHQGTQRDAILFSVGANAAHGLRRTNADKRQSVMTLLNDPEWVEWSDNKIAEQAAVSDMLVRDVRKQLQESCSSPAAEAADKPRVGRDGKKRRPRRPKAKPAKEREPGEDPVERRHKVTPPAATDETPFDKSLAGLDWVLSTAVPRVQEYAILAQDALGGGRGDFSADRISKLMKQVHDSFTSIRGVLANAQQKHRRKSA